MPCGPVACLPRIFCQAWHRHEYCNNQLYHLADKDPANFVQAVHKHLWVSVRISGYNTKTVVGEAGRLYASVRRLMLVPPVQLKQPFVVQSFPQRTPAAMAVPCLRQRIVARLQRGCLQKVLQYGTTAAAGSRHQLCVGIARLLRLRFRFEQHRGGE